MAGALGQFSYFQGFRVPGSRQNQGMDPQSRPPLFSLWDLLALVGFAGLWVLYLQVLPTLPDPVPTHFDALGRANGWTPKAALPILLFGLPALIWGITTATAIAASRTQADPARAQAAAMYPMRGLLGLGLALVFGSSLLIPSQGPRVLLGALVAFFVLLGLGIVLTARAFGALPGSAREGYRWGLVYANPDDPRIFVPKRIGVGWTLNFGRPVSWLILILMLLPIAGGLAIARHFS